MGSEDKTISISDSEGDTLKVISMRADPSDLQMVQVKSDERPTPDTMVINLFHFFYTKFKNSFVFTFILFQLSVVIGKLVLLLYNLQDPENPIECNFQERYGNIVAYEWYG